MKNQLAPWDNANVPEAAARAGAAAGKIIGKMAATPSPNPVDAPAGSHMAAMMADGAQTTGGTY